ncbi:MAG: hypothetical protein ACRDXB_08495, partial [Actinomycetes bacterium]
MNLWPCAAVREHLGSSGLIRGVWVRRDSDDDFSVSGGRGYDEAVSRRQDLARHGVEPRTDVTQLSFHA